MKRSKSNAVRFGFLGFSFSKQNKRRFVNKNRTGQNKNELVETATKEGYVITNSRFLNDKSGVFVKGRKLFKR